MAHKLVNFARTAMASSRRPSCLKKMAALPNTTTFDDSIARARSWSRAAGAMSPVWYIPRLARRESACALFGSVANALLSAYSLSVQPSSGSRVPIAESSMKKPRGQRHPGTVSSNWPACHCTADDEQSICESFQSYLRTG